MRRGGGEGGGEEKDEGMCVYVPISIGLSASSTEDTPRIVLLALSCDSTP